MALFDRKRSSYESVAPLYTLGSSQTLLVVGLGNIGSEYTNTRHNLGFMVLDKYQTTHDFSGWTNKKDLKCEIAIGQIGSTRVILVKPTTFMNNSGEAVQRIQKFYQVYNRDTLVIHDELDIEYGTIRSRVGGGNAGHNGIKSLTELLGEDYGRIRVGIGPKTHEKMDSADFVLQDFSENQVELLPKVINEVCNMIDERTTGQLPEHTVTL